MCIFVEWVLYLIWGKGIWIIQKFRESNFLFNYSGECAARIAQRAKGTGWTWASRSGWERSFCQVGEGVLGKCSQALRKSFPWKGQRQQEAALCSGVLTELCLQRFHQVGTEAEKGTPLLLEGNQRLVLGHLGPFWSNMQHISLIHNIHYGAIFLIVHWIFL